MGLQIKLHAHFKLSMGGHRELEYVMDDIASQNLAKDTGCSSSCSLENVILAFGANEMVK